MHTGFPHASVFSLATLSLTGCLSLLETITYRDAAPPMLDASRADATATDSTSDRNDPDSTPRDAGFAEASPMDIIDSTHTDAGFDVTHVVDATVPDAVTGDAPADVTIPDASPPDAGLRCGSEPYACPVSLVTCTDLNAALQDAALAAQLPNCCVFDSDCLLLSTETCCGSNLAVSPSSAATCVDFLYLDYATRCGSTVVCPRVLCMDYAVHCSGGSCVRTLATP